MIYGGSGYDTLCLTFDDARLRKALERELRDGPNWRGEYKFDAVRLTVRDVARIINTDEAPDTIGVDNFALQANIDAAELWSLI